MSIFNMQMTEIANKLGPALQVGESLVWDKQQQRQQQQQQEKQHVPPPGLPQKPLPALSSNLQQPPPGLPQKPLPALTGNANPHHNLKALAQKADPNEEHLPSHSPDDDNLPPPYPGKSPMEPVPSTSKEAPPLYEDIDPPSTLDNNNEPTAPPMETPSQEDHGTGAQLES